MSFAKVTFFHAFLLETLKWTVHNKTSHSCSGIAHTRNKLLCKIYFLLTYLHHSRIFCVEWRITNPVVWTIFAVFTIVQNLRWTWVFVVHQLDEPSWLIAPEEIQQNIKNRFMTIMAVYYHEIIDFSQDRHAWYMLNSWENCSLFLCLQNLGELQCPDLDFIYNDTDSHPNEIAELYSYTEQGEFQQNTKVKFLGTLYTELGCHIENCVFFYYLLGIRRSNGAVQYDAELAKAIDCRSQKRHYETSWWVGLVTAYVTHEGGTLYFVFGSGKSD